MENKILEFIKSEKKIFNLFGPAGTGKTTIITKTLIDKNILKEYDIKFTAPTHKAVSVLAEKIKKINIKDLNIVISISTIHALLKCKMSFGTGGKRVFKPLNKKYNEVFDKKGILIIDESSMIDENLYSYIKIFQEVTDCKIIFIGDNLQLPPVGEIISLIFKDAMETKKFNVLKKNYRSTNLKLVTDFRNYVKNGNDNPINKYIKRDFNLENDYSNIKSDDKIILCWRNITVKETNTEVRKLIWKDLCDKRFNIGENMICNKTFNIGELTVYSGTKIIIETIQINTAKDNIKYYLINDLYTVVLKDSLRRFEKILYNKKKYILSGCLSGKEKSTAWKDYYKFSDFNNPIDYGYATTVHKSQGSGYDYVFVNYCDISRNRNSLEMRKCLYTSVSRHVKDCIIY
jgi:ATP-dependent exoDNAse (exonuclease V) alpha subunit